MNAPAKLWVSTLRDGLFDQCRTRLRSGDAFDVMGVACELFRRSTGHGWWDGNVFMLDGVRCTTEAPLRVRAWLGLAEGPRFGPDRPPIDLLTLSKLGDAGETFPRIAQVIAWEPPGLFR